MTEMKNISWKRITIEVAAIVGSILLAFAIDAGREGQRDRELEQELLASLIQEFEGAATEFKIRWTGHDERLTAAKIKQAYYD